MTKTNIAAPNDSRKVIPMVTPASVNEAWEAYRAHASRLADDTSLMLDRDFMERHALLHDKWRQLFLFGTRG